MQFLFDEKIITLENLMSITNYNEKLIAKILGLEEEFLTAYLQEPTFFGVSYISERRNGGSQSS